MNNKFVFLVIIVIIIGVVISFNTRSSEIEIIELPDKYSSIGPFSDGLARVENANGKMGFVNDKLEEVINCEYTVARDFDNGVAEVMKDRETIYIDKNGNEVEKPYNNVWRDIPQASKDIIPMSDQNNKYGYVNKYGEEVIPYIYDFGGSFVDGLAFVIDIDNEECKFINEFGNTEIELDFPTSSGYFSENLAVVMKDKKSGYIDKSGNLVIDYIYDDAMPFSEGLAAVCKNDKWGYIDKEGNIVIDFMYDETFEMNFSEDLVVARENDKCGYIDKKGNIVVDFKYDIAGEFSQGVAIVVKDEKFGCINKKGKEIIECEYDTINVFSDGVSTAKKDNKWYILKIKD